MKALARSAWKSDKAHFQDMSHDLLRRAAEGLREGVEVFKPPLLQAIPHQFCSATHNTRKPPSGACT